MKNLSVILILLALNITGFSQKKLKIEEVVEEGVVSNFVLTTTTANAEFDNGLKIKMEIVDGSSLDDYFFKLREYDGRYNYTFYSKDREGYFLNKKKRKRFYTKDEVEFLFEGLDWLLDNDYIDEDVNDKFEAEILFGREDELEDNYYSTSTYNYFNPYVVPEDGKYKYLSLIKLTIENTSDGPLSNDLDISIFNSDEVFSYLTNYELSSLYQTSALRDRKFNSLVRSNIDFVDLFPGKSKTVKYAAFLPFSLSNDNILAKISNSSQTIDFVWKGSVDKTEIKKVYNYYEIRLKPDAGTFRSYYIVTDDSPKVYIVGNYLYVQEQDIDKPVSFYYLGMKKNKLFHGKVNEVKASDYLEIPRLKRSKIKFNVGPISDIKRREKTEK
ncbi:MAG: hypothetical protein K8R68_09520 [Bacteroidales bacterium]|nr:hypothetical protein [Bacteroidales bacterium]